jgi:O-acetyl-ADP-ribose deacetylase (regulator of RNase III)
MKDTHLVRGVILKGNRRSEYMDQKQRRQYLIGELLKEDLRYTKLQVPEGEEEQRQLLRGLMNVRMPKRISEEFLKVQDEYLQEEIRRNGIVELEDLTPLKEGIYLWQGDITTLRCDGIVNAANSGLTGCYIPNHRCIDNCIHSFSGIQLRLACEKLMQEQGYEEPTGHAKITPAYNLPCKYVLHTVGPIISGNLTVRDCELLASCYRSCLELAAEHGLESIAFCCISTGVFHFPNDKAAEIAVRTVTEFMEQESSVKNVIFNVFKDLDKEIYSSLLQ